MNEHRRNSRRRLVQPMRRGSPESLLRGSHAIADARRRLQATLRLVDAVEQKVIMPQSESICRNIGSKMKAVELLVGLIVRDQRDNRLRMFRDPGQQAGRIERSNRLLGRHEPPAGSWNSRQLRELARGRTVLIGLARHGSE